MRLSLVRSVVLVAAVTAGAWAQQVAKISVIEGNAGIMRTDHDKWINARPAMALSVGDQVFCRTESFVEVRYNSGAVLRMDENTKITIERSSGDSTRTRSTLGTVWVNMKKITKKGSTFDVASPTAVASIRGTVYAMQTGSDSSTDVSVFDGAVAVGLTDDVKNSLPAKPGKNMGEPVEVPGPEEVPGPFEVSLEQWKTIVAGQKISVRKDGKYAQSQIDMKTAGADRFVKKNQELDKALGSR